MSIPRLFPAEINVSEKEQSMFKHKKKHRTNCRPKTSLQFHTEVLESRQMMTFTVNSLADGPIDFGDSELTLREAVALSNVVSGTDVITFEPSLSGTIRLVDELELKDAVTITAHEDITIDAGNNSRIFSITASTGDFELRGLTLVNGTTTADSSTYGGGAIRSLTEGELRLRDMDIRDNSTSGTGANGGAVYAVGDVAVSGSVIVLNQTIGENADGGAIFSEQSVEIQGSIVAYNETFGDRSTGGAISAEGSVGVSSSSVDNNRTRGMYSDGGAIAALRDLTIQAHTSVYLNETLGHFATGGAASAGRDVSIVEGEILDKPHSR